MPDIDVKSITKSLEIYSIAIDDARIISGLDSIKNRNYLCAGKQLQKQAES